MQIEKLLEAYIALYGDAYNTRAFHIFLSKHSEVTSRKNLAGHITGSAIVWHRSSDTILRVHHTKLDRWVFSAGGHVDDGELPWQTAVRELHEETGISADPKFDPEFPLPFFLDVQPIPASLKKFEPAHWHYDMIYLFEVAFKPMLDADPEEIKDFRWVKTADVTLANAPVDFRQQMLIALSGEVGLSS